MSHPNPYEQLGVAEDASFEDIQAARTRLLSESSADRKLAEAIEMAYDAVLMDRLRLRQEGRIAVPDRIRYPERASARASVASPEAPARQMPNWLKNTLDRPARNELLWPSGTFLLLAGLAVGIPGVNSGLLQLILAGGAGAGLFFLNRKENKFGRSVLLALAALIGGLLVGSLVAPLPPVAAVLGAEQVAAAGALVALWLTSCFLR